MNLKARVMKKLNRNKLGSILSLLMIAMVSCTESDNTYEIEAFEKPVFEVNASETSIDFGNSITFTDNSTMVHEREWSFLGGSPASSNDPSVIVTYGSGGTYEATLTVKHIDNQEYSETFTIEVAGPTIETFSFYTESASVSFGNQVIPQNNNAYTNLGSTTNEAFEGEQSMYFDFDNIDTWGTQGTLLADGGTVDISTYATGTYNVALKTTCQKRMLIRLHGLSLDTDNPNQEERAIITLDPALDSYGLKRDGAWYVLEIPVADFLSANENIDLTRITHAFVFRSDETVLGADDWDWYLDHFFLSKEIE